MGLSNQYSFQLVFLSLSSLALWVRAGAVFGVGFWELFKVQFKPPKNEKLISVCFETALLLSQKQGQLRSPRG